MHYITSSQHQLHVLQSVHLIIKNARAHSHNNI